MKFEELDQYWQRLFLLEWESLCKRSKAIAALIVDTDGTVISEGRNKIGENLIPNPRVSHAEVEAVRNLDVQTYPDVKNYVLYAALEPCPMCMGTLVMGGIRNVVIGAHDDHGGAVELLEKSAFLRSKHVQITWMPQIYGEIQRGLQAIKELLYNEDKEKLQRMLLDFSVYNLRGVEAAKQMVAEGLFAVKQPGEYKAEEMIQMLMDKIEKGMEI